MKNKYKIYSLILTMIFVNAIVFSDSYKAESTNRLKYNFNTHWRFYKASLNGAGGVSYNDSSWQEVHLPHSVQIEPLSTSNSYQGEYWYRKHFKIDDSNRGKKIFIEFEAGMQIADVWINGTYKTTHYGGYLPFTVDISDNAYFGNTENIIAVKLNNKDNPTIPPGKPEANLDFCYFGGLYRDAWLHITNPVYITDAVYANKTASGGVFISYNNINSSIAEVNIKTHIRNESGNSIDCQVKTSIVDSNNNVVAAGSTSIVTIGNNRANSFNQNITVRNPRLWHPDHPYLYTVYTNVARNGIFVDDYKTKIGIRWIEFSHYGGFVLNGTRLKFMGANRHQDYPYVGNAVPNSAQYRDALKMKEAGFQYVRLSHYPQDPAFLDACNELGLLVLDCIPGWQYWSTNNDFVNRSLQDMRDMIRRDRNHPSIIAWETSLNESSFTTTYASNANRIVHEEYPGSQAFSAGWRHDGYWDVWIESSQAGVRSYNGSSPVIISEYGDWDYGGNSSTSRVPRGGEESKLLQMAWNHQESLNRNRSLSWLAGDGLWVFNDYNRGYRSDICYAGAVDLFRLPKYSYYFFQSQRNPDLIIPGVDSGPMVFIADKWQAGSNSLRVFSNCEQVQLYINGNLTATRSPDTGSQTGDLLHPPFTFSNLTWTSGTIKARGLIGGVLKASHSIKTAGTVNSIEVKIDTMNKDFVGDGSDLVFVYAYLNDSNGSLVNTSTADVIFSVSGPGRIIGNTEIKAEAGIAGAILQSTKDIGVISITASASGISGRASITSIAMAEEYPFNDSAQMPTGNPTPTPTPTSGPTEGPTPRPPTGSGSITREYWTDISGNNISDLTNNNAYPSNPTGTDFLTRLEYENFNDNYGTRIRGFLTPEASRDYIFYLSADDSAELWLSSDSSPDKKQLIAQVPGWTEAHEWNKYPEQISQSVALVYNQLYYIEIIHKDGVNADHLAVAWETAGLLIEVISGNNLIPYKENPEEIPGDVNTSGEVDIVDALLIAQYYVGLNPPNFNTDVADVNGDSTIDIVDALLIAQYYVGLIPSF